MKLSGPIRRRTRLRRGQPPRRRTPLRRSTPLVRRTPLSSHSPERRLAIVLMSASRAPGAASAAQREKIIGSACVVCAQTRGLTPAHLAPRSLGGCDDADCVVPLCWLHHRAYDTGRLELLPYLEPGWRAEVAHAVLHLGLIGAYRRLTAQRSP
jgi:hypothetical protein